MQQIFYQAGAHYVIETMDELSDLTAIIERRMRKGDVANGCD